MSPRTTTRRLATTLAAIAGAGLIVTLTGAPAMAHGGFTYPATRTYACYVDALQGGTGNLNPTNPECINMLAVNGNYPFYNWFGNLLSNAAGGHESAVPDGNLCGPQAAFSGARRPGTDWPTTTMQSGAQTVFQFAAWAKHPGTFYQYVTKDGWDPTQPLKWSDLETVPFDQITNPPVRSGGPQGDEYYWTATLPNKTGRHIIYSIWARSDSQETFYNCSDVMFQGTTSSGDTTAPTTPGTPTVTTAAGTTASLTWAASTDNVAVTTYTVHNATSNAVLATTTNPTATLSSLTPSTSYSVYVVAHDAAGNASAHSPTLTFSSGTVPASSCQVAFTAPSAWVGGFVGQVAITNNAATPINTWTLRWTFTRGETLTQAWNAVATQSGAVVTASNVAWNVTIASHSTVTFGYLGSGELAPGVPTGVTLNGSSCTLA